MSTLWWSKDSPIDELPNIHDFHLNYPLRIGRREAMLQWITHFILLHPDKTSTVACTSPEEAVKVQKEICRRMKGMVANDEYQAV